MIRCLIALAFACSVVDAHGVLLRPISRALRDVTGAHDGLPYVGGCMGGACQWYTQRAHVTGNITNCDARYRTMGVHCGSKDPVDWTCTPGEAVPWCSPGAAKVKSPCGIFSGGYGTNGRDMLDLDSTSMATWTAGQPAEVAWGVIANHGGGYSYRLCPNKEGVVQDEACFQAHHLNYTKETSDIVDAKGNLVATFPSRRTVTGTTPAGSPWTRNPMPMEKGVIEPIPGHPEIFGRGPYYVAIKDTVLVPDLPTGEYTLSLRWDSEQVQQVWAQCSDVTIKNEPTSVPSPPKNPSKSFAVCNEDSLGLDVLECDAWARLYDQLNGDGWGVPNMRLNPCNPNLPANDSWAITIVCDQFRDAMSITEIYLLGERIAGPFPSFITEFTNLRALSFAASGVTGELPADLGSLTKLEMIWLDDNAKLGGAIPQSLTKIGHQLSVLEMHQSAFSGTMLPDLPYANIADCTLNGLVFKCPLPPGAETCGAVCQ